MNNETIDLCGKSYSRSFYENALRCVQEGRCVHCCQFLDGRMTTALVNAWNEIALLKCQLSIEQSKNEKHKSDW